jgi:hypothetical protein
VPSENNVRQFDRQLRQHGAESLKRSRSSLERRLFEHRKKLEEYRSIGGYTSSVEKEIRNFEDQIAAIDEVLRRHSDE